MLNSSRSQKRDRIIRDYVLSRSVLNMIFFNVKIPIRGRKKYHVLSVSVLTRFYYNIINLYSKIILIFWSSLIYYSKYIVYIKYFKFQTLIKKLLFLKFIKNLHNITIFEEILLK